MLVLSRNVGEKIVINNNIVITIVEFRGSKIRIGIEAPREIPVHRYEVWLNVVEEKKEHGES